MLRGESKKVCSQGSMFIQREESWQILGPLPPVPTTSAVLIPTSIPKSTPKRVCSDSCGLHRIIVNDEYTSRSGWFLFKKSVPYCILFPHLRALSHGHLCGSSSYTLDSFFLFCPGYWHMGSEFPDQGLNPYPAAVQVCSPNHWTTRELLGLFLLTAA
ncbi:unnamed protein product [Rangifer tarandus platyrhynchus]|uniref:Uncharacterized protein n=1 Tax=Rangifer tarandus platyrhynchus TaxID=3082113 RepID=A0ABN8YPF5_RANTA|nr:unnamed protein product [Rangifer tarandus platyrhynchus]